MARKEHRIDIQVTEAQIELATKADSGHCMIADAIKEALPDAVAVSVDLQTIRFSDRKLGLRYVYFTPGFAQQQLLRFDQGVPLQPWVLRLPSRPAQVLKIVSRQGEKNTARRPLTPGPKKLLKDAVPVVKGGFAPDMGLLAHSSYAGPANHKGQRRIFGIKAARGFNPTEPPPQIVPSSG